MNSTEIGWWFSGAENAMMAIRAVAPTVITKFEADADVVDHRREPHAVDVDQHADEDDGDREQDLRALGQRPAHQSAEVPGQDEADPGHAAHPAHQGDEAGEPGEVGTVDAADPLIGVAGERELRGEVGRDERPEREDRACQQQRPHERCTRGEVAAPKPVNTAVVALIVAKPIANDASVPTERSSFWV